MDWKIELADIPVTDVDRAIDFYSDKLGFNVDLDHAFSETARFVQLTPPGSACSISLGLGISGKPPGSVDGLVLVVDNVAAARAQLAERGVEVSELQIYDEGVFRPAREGDGLDRTGFFFFNDPDGNRWAVQQIARS
jgi:catechol 2,3-dioxygenase-like lactoylglutathione lyase family enzyme